MTIKGQKRISYTILVLPALIIYLLVVGFPTIFSIILSLTNYNGGKILGAGSVDWEVVGFQSYVWMFTEPTGAFYSALKNNMYLVAISVFGQIPLGFILAYILTRNIIKRGSGFFQSMIFLPYVISPIIIGVLFNAFIINSNSVLMEVRKMIDPTVQFTISTRPMMAVLLVVLWMFTGFYMIIFMAHMQRIDPAIIEAARIDGAKESQVLGRIILPAMINEILTCAILAISGSLRTYDLIYSMTSGGPAGQTKVLSMFMYDMAFKGSPNYPVANAISTVMVLICLVLIVITQCLGKMFKDGEA
ncbi:MAG: sugar ABC transporter permease [Lachnospiraceae bacterium]|nr:sugar ABC transporter permease [Lachnospiraceae bacterium]